jgi:hypothetical protein
MLAPVVSLRFLGREGQALAVPDEERALHRCALPVACCAAEAMESWPAHDVPGDGS